MIRVSYALSTRLFSAERYNLGVEPDSHFYTLYVPAYIERLQKGRDGSYETELPRFVVPLATGRRVSSSISLILRFNPSPFGRSVPT